MVDVGISTNPIPQSKPRQVGKTPNGRLIYEIKDATTGDAKLYTIPEENKDKYEQTVQKMQEKYGKYEINNAKKLMQLSHFVTISGAIAGGSLTASIIKTTSKIGKFFKTLGGAIGGVVVASGIFAGIIIHKGIKLGKELNQLGVKEYKEKDLPINQKEESPAKETEKTSN